MIEKKGKVNLVQDMIIINQIEVEFSLNNKVLSQETMQCTKENNLIPREQHGSRKGHRSITQSLNNMLFNYLNQLTRRPMMLFSYNAKSYHDKIAHSIAILD